jgi:hypothetical protein
MARWIGLVALFMGMGLTSYYSARQGGQRAKPVTVEQGVHTMEGGTGAPPHP